MVKNMPDREHARRVERLQAAMARRKLDAMFVFDRANTFYLTGFRGTFSFLLIGRRDSVMLVDGRYIEAVRAQVRHCEVRLLTNRRPAFEKWQREFNPRRIGFEGGAPWSQVHEWQQYLPGAEWEEAESLIHKLRLIKSPEEVRWIEQSARLNDTVFEKALEAARAGATELDVRGAIHREADRLGTDGLSFEAIVATGTMTSRPHYHPQARALAAGDLLLIDLGVLAGGYCSDMTRTVGLARKPKPRLMKAYEAVLEAQQAALVAVAPGVACAELDRIARDILKKRKLGRYFTHGLGHGVGIEIHEAPTLNGKSKEVLRPGMVITIEPGVYLPGIGGIRIEDLVVVTRNGYKVLSRSPKAFRLLPF